MEKSENFKEYSFEKMINLDDKDPKLFMDEEMNSVKQNRFKRIIEKNLLMLVTISGVILGVVIGFSLRCLELGADTILLISYPGELFMRILKLMILPLIVSSLIAGSASLNAKMNGKIAVRTLTYFVLTSMFNAMLGIYLVVTIHPGDPGLKQLVQATEEHSRDVRIMDSFLDLGRNLFPDNLVQATFQQSYTAFISPRGYSHLEGNNSTQNMNEMIRIVKYRSGTNTLGLVLFCLIFGSVLGTMGQKGQGVISFFSTVFDVIMKIVIGVMWISPIGISSVIAGKILSVDKLGLVMSQLGWFIATVIIGIYFYQLIVMQLIYLVILRKNPFVFYGGLIQAMLTASATASTAAALPVTFRCMTEKLKIDTRITRFILPIACNINTDGTALFVAIASIFIAQMNGIVLGFGEYCTVFFTSTIASLSTVSVPSAALVMLLVVLTSINAPTQDISLLFAVDWFVDRFRTTNNMLGDCYCAAVVEHLSKAELQASNNTNTESTEVNRDFLKLIDTVVEDVTNERKVLSSPHTLIIDMNTAS